MTKPARKIILNVDDNEAGLYTTTRMLRQAGFEVWEASTGAEALRQVAQHPDLVILDVHLPDMSGFEVCRRIKEDPTTRFIPVLHLSAVYVKPTDRATGLEGGADAYLVQPVTREELVATVRSLLRLKEAEDELRKNSAFLEAVFSSIQDGISVLAPDLTVVRVNEVMRKWYAPNLPLEGKKCYRAYHDADEPCEPCPTLRCLQSGTTECEIVPGLPGSAAAWFELFAYPLRDTDSGETVGVVEFVRDITAHKRAEEEAKKLQEQLGHAQKMEAMGRLAGGVAHDFNNMLWVIKGYTERALQKLDPGSPIYADLQEVYGAAKRSTALTRQLLAFARRQVATPRVLDLNETVESMLKMLRRLIREEIELAWMPGHNLWRVRIDPDQVNQILANLAVNSRDAISGVGKLTIGTENVSLTEEQPSTGIEGRAPGDYVRLAVSDTGCGMDAETLEHIYEPFFTTKERGQGTGLGLSTVYGIVRQNDGFIEVESAPGRGTTFRIYLPRCMDESTEVVEKIEVRGGTETVLFVEDEEAVLKLGKSLLEELGYTTLAANGPAEALRAVEEYDGPLHLMITDVIMPEMNGRELAERISAMRPGLKCLYLSGYPDDVIAQRGLLGENLQFMQKPFSIAELARKVREVLET